LTVIERKTWNIFLKKAFNNLLENKTHEISVHEVYDNLNWKSDGNHEALKGVCKKLVETSVQWNMLNKDKKNAWGITGFLSYAEVKDGICSYRFDESIVSLLFSPNIYAKLDMNIQKKIKNKYAHILWEIFVEELSVGNKKEGNIFLPNFVLRALLGLKDNEYYQEFKYFNQDIIKPALLEINKISDIEISHVYIKRARVTVGIQFIFKYKKVPLEITEKSIDDFEKILDLAEVVLPKISKSKKQSSGMLELNPICKVSDSVREKMGKYGFSDKEIMGLVEKSGSDNIEESIDAAIQYITGSSSEIKTPKAVIKKAIKDSWGMDNGKEKIIAEQAEKIEKDREEKIKEFLQKANEYQIFIVNHAIDKNKGYWISGLCEFTLKDFSDEDGENFLLDIQTKPHDDWRDLEKIIIDNKESFRKEFPAINTIRINGTKSIIKFKETE
jgi:hypothetical protein